jgi:hypothetical protein
MHFTVNEICLRIVIKSLKVLFGSFENTKQLQSYDATIYFVNLNPYQYPSCKKNYVPIYNICWDAFYSK